MIECAFGDGPLLMEDQLGWEAWKRSRFCKRGIATACGLCEAKISRRIGLYWKSMLPLFYLRVMRQLSAY